MLSLDEIYDGKKNYDEPEDEDDDDDDGDTPPPYLDEFEYIDWCITHR